MTSREALRMLETRCRYFATDNLEIEEIYEARGIIEKDLEVLEILKNKLVFPLALMSMPYELYNKSVMKEQQLTQEEYDKVKEYFKYDK